MATLVSLVDPSDTFGGLRDGYRRAQLGQPNATAGQLPKFRGETNTPGQSIKAPKILSSAARQDKGTNATIPYARKFCPPRTHALMHTHTHTHSHSGQGEGWAVHVPTCCIGFKSLPLQLVWQRVA